MTALLLAAALAATPAPDGLDRLAAALRAARAWQADFVQLYTPEGFDEGTTDRGRLVIAPPANLRFDYTSGSPRVFAADGGVGRLVDASAGSCDAVRLDAGTWGRLPLATVLDPAATRHAFAVESSGQTVRLVPREPGPELAEVILTMDSDNLPRTVTVRDASGNRNQFTFSGWRAVAVPAPAFFQPALPGSRPCQPEQ
jgi:outer membrane lipoprotein-sorting protein